MECAMEEIILVGTDKEAEIFLYQNRHKYKVQLFVDELPRRHSFRGVSVVSLDSIIDYLTGEMKIVIATNLEKYQRIARVLASCKLVEFEHFVYYEAVTKKMALFFGNCQCKALEFYMEQILEFRKEYWIYPYKAIDQNNSDYIAKVVLNHCDLLIYQDVKETTNGVLNSSNYFLECMPKHAKTIKIPNLFKLGFGFYPQSTTKRLAAMRETEHLFVVNTDNHDKVITKLFKEGLAISEIQEQLKSDHILNEEEVQKNFEHYMQQIKTLDSGWDIKIYDYIEKYYKERLIFIDPGHVSNHIYHEYICQLFNLLDLKLECELKKVLDTNKHTLDMPIYPCVANYLGLTYINAETKCKENSFTLTDGSINFEEYIKQYIFVCVDSTRI